MLENYDCIIRTNYFHYCVNIYSYHYHYYNNYLHIKYPKILQRHQRFSQNVTALIFEWQALLILLNNMLGSMEQLNMVQNGNNLEAFNLYQSCRISVILFYCSDVLTEGLVCKTNYLFTINVEVLYFLFKNQPEFSRNSRNDSVDQSSLVPLISFNNGWLLIIFDFCQNTKYCNVTYIAQIYFKCYVLLYCRCVRITDTGLGYLSTMSSLRNLYLRWCCQVSMALLTLYS